MNIHTYKAAIVDHPTLYESLIEQGVDMGASIIKCIPEYISATPTGDVNIDIHTDSLKAVCDVAVTNSLSGALKANKEALKKSISDKSTELVKNGLSHTTATGFSGVFPIENAKEELSFYHAVADSLKDNPLEAPQIIPTLDSGAVPIMNDTEASALNDDARHRMEYIYSSLTANADLSKSELLLSSEVDAALNQAELDLIADTRV